MSTRRSRSAREKKLSCRVCPGLWDVRARLFRSEERRVGKECRSLCDWSSDVCSSDLIAVTGHVDEEKPVGEGEEVELPRMPRTLGRAREALSPRQGVDQARLADIRAADEGDFGKARLRELIELGDAVKEAAFRREEEAAGLERRRVLGRRCRPHCRQDRTPARRMITHCCRMERQLFQAQ